MTWRQCANREPCENDRLGKVSLEGATSEAEAQAMVEKMAQESGWQQVTWWETTVEDTGYRMAHEAAVHRWDAQMSIGPAEPLEAKLAADPPSAVRETQAKAAVAVASPAAAAEVRSPLQSQHHPQPQILSGPDAVSELAAWPCDVVLNGVTGAAGLAATLAALDAGRVLALANKESLIVGGPLVTSRAKPGQIVPVDSEHSTIAQCLRAGRLVIRIIHADKSVTQERSELAASFFDLACRGGGGLQEFRKIGFHLQVGVMAVIDSGCPFLMLAVAEDRARQLEFFRLGRYQHHVILGLLAARLVLERVSDDHQRVQ